MTVPGDGAPVRLELPAAPDAAGAAHGEALRGEIADALARWRAALASRFAGDVDDLVDRLATRTGFLAAAERHAPDLVAELRGIARGAGRPFAELLAYNLMDELWWWSGSQGFDLRPGARDDEPPGCSGIAALRPGRPPIVAQTMDLPRHHADAPVVLDLPATAARPATRVLTVAGMIGLLGVNDAPLGACVNTLMRLRRSTEGVPVAFVLRLALGCRSAADAVALLARLPHASGQNYLLADATAIRDVECSAGGAAEVAAVDGVLVHANHPLASRDDEPGYVPGEAEARSSRARQALLEREAPRRRDDPLAVLADRTAPVCRVGEAPHDVHTVWTAVFELSSPPATLLLPGPPDRAPRFAGAPGSPLRPVAAP